MNGKKRIALLLGLLMLCMAFAAACTQTPAQESSAPESAAPVE